LARVEARRQGRSREVPPLPGPDVPAVRAPPPPCRLATPSPGRWTARRSSRATAAPEAARWRRQCKHPLTRKTAFFHASPTWGAPMCCFPLERGMAWGSVRP